MAFPAFAPPAGPVGPGSAPGPNPGSTASAVTKINEAVNLLQSALPDCPIGTDLHKATLDAIQKLSKVAPASAAVPGVQMSTLQGLQRDAQQSAMLQQLTRAMGAQTGAPMPQSPQM